MKRIASPVDTIIKIVPTHYEILQVIEDASIEIIQEAYKQLSEKSQSSNNSSDLLTKINRAYEVLSDSKQRKAYDDTLQQERATPLIEKVPHRHVFYQEKNIKHNDNIRSQLKKNYRKAKAENYNNVVVSKRINSLRTKMAISLSVALILFIIFYFDKLFT